MCVCGNKWIGARVRVKWTKGTCRETESVSVQHYKRAAKKCCRIQIHPKNYYGKNRSRRSFDRLSVRSFVQREYTQQSTTPCTVTESTRSNRKSRWKRTDRISKKEHERPGEKCRSFICLSVCLKAQTQLKMNWNDHHRRNCICPIKISA